MQRARHPARKLSRTHRPLVRHILAITSERWGLTKAEREELSRIVLAQLTDPLSPDLDSLARRGKLRTYLTVLIQKTYQELDIPAATSCASPVENAVQQTSSTLPVQEGLILKMWFESGMTTQRIASVLGLRPGDVHAVIASRTSRVQEWLVHENPSPPND